MKRAEGWECYHCKAWVEPGEDHDCWTTTEAALTSELSEDLRDAWERLREAAADFGPQRIYASGTAIMFSRKVCYFFVRPKRSFLEVVFFLGRAVRAPQIRRADSSSRTKTWHVIHVRHRDEVETPITDWLREAYDLEEVLAQAKTLGKKSPKPPKLAKQTAKTAATKAKTASRPTKTAKHAAKKVAMKPSKKPAARKRAGAAGSRQRTKRG